MNGARIVNYEEQFRGKRLPLFVFGEPPKAACVRREFNDALLILRSGRLTD